MSNNFLSILAAERARRENHPPRVLRVSKPVAPRPVKPPKVVSKRVKEPKPPKPPKEPKVRENLFNRYDSVVLENMKLAFENPRGGTLGKVAQAHGLSLPSLRRIASLNGWKGRYDHDNPYVKKMDELIVRLYTKDKLSTLQIAAKFRALGYRDMTDEKVRNRLILQGVDRGNNYPKDVLNNYYQFKHLGQKDVPAGHIVDFIKDNYANLTIQEMADALSIGRKAVIIRLRALGLKPTGYKEHKKAALELAVRYYINNDVTLKQAANKFGVSKDYVSAKVKKDYGPAGVAILKKRRGRY